MRASSGDSPGRIQSCGSCRGAVPASLARMIAAQSGAAGLCSLSATAARAPLDAAARELRGVEEPRELGVRQLGHLARHLADRAPLGIRCLGNRGALLVPD